jgi:cytochrome o ubiquinol oxidase subunit 2
MTKRNKKFREGSSIWITIIGLLGLALVLAWLLKGKDVILFNPKGLIAEQESRLMVLTTLIMTGFAVVILSFLYFFAWKYRETNHKSEFKASAGRSKVVLAAAWTAPFLIFVVLASIMLPATQKLEPQRTLESDSEQITIRAIAMRWKWVFLYPEHDIATVNYVQIPVDTPIRFELTADEAPMNSFWIPHLSGMLYAMTEHVNTLNLIASEPGDYEGGAAEISGRGFAGMRFTTRVSPGDDFDAWVADTAQRSAELDASEYDKLLELSENNPVALYYSPSNREIFAALLKKYSGGSHNHYTESENTEHEGH